MGLAPLPHPAGVRPPAERPPAPAVSPGPAGLHQSQVEHVHILATGTAAAGVWGGRGGTGPGLLGKFGILAGRYSTTVTPWKVR